MRHTILVLATAAGVAAAAGCAGSPQRLDGQASPAGAATPAPPSATTAAPAVSPAVSPSVTPSSASPKPSKTSRSPTTPVLGPTGFGKLYVGMSIKAAAATGEVDATGTGCGSAPLKSANDADVTVIYSERGLLYIPAYGRIATPEGIRIGSTYEQVDRAYSDFFLRAIDAEGGFNGSGTAFAGEKDGHAGVHYRFAFKNSKVTELALEHDDQNCYE
ncbi:hypothetical protein FHR83_009008 [Actinoplanes campanulatus]|uniref:Lipoprotein n=1 Tax=Actinoplanes campanulatus TaxID=113559 RepID=A0A7W5AS46_9ACTN|nr:hypothetical protein [Actinoplanes campanulatus]MBB3101280.1 hypothetical protein [Actinoplanes campanulatus]GGN50767.1 hypothetical protein GCM10010109_90300 [Actinoplanes campanulatus]GID42163.1 hypothetical protein Aca09nite_86690 [Actinoplanes campanulatus]